MMVAQSDRLKIEKDDLRLAAERACSTPRGYTCSRMVSQLTYGRLALSALADEINIILWATTWFAR